MKIGWVTIHSCELADELIAHIGKQYFPFRLSGQGIYIVLALVVHSTLADII